MSYFGIFLLALLSSFDVSACLFHIRGGCQRASLATTVVWTTYGRHTVWDGSTIVDPDGMLIMSSLFHYIILYVV